MSAQTDPAPTTRARLLAPPATWAYLGLGLAVVLAGSLLDSLAAVLLGGGVVVALLLDAVWLVGRKTPKATLGLDPGRVPEESRATIRLETAKATRDDQAYVPLGRGLRLVDAPNIWNPSSTRRTASYSFDVRAMARGPQAVGPLRVRRWSPGRAWALQIEGEQRTLEVVPRHEDVRRVGLRNQTLRPMQGRFVANRPGQGFDFFALREYQPGDTIRSINWKASARTEDLVVNQRERETHTELLLLLDARSIMGTGPVGRTALDRACRVVVALANDALRQRDAVRFAVYGDGAHALHLGRGHEAVLDLEDYLAALPARGSTPSWAAFEAVRTDLRGSGPVVMITTLEADPTVTMTVAELLAMGHPVTVISPTPEGDSWSSSSAKERVSRHNASVVAVRKLGATVVAWEPGQGLWAPRPSRPGGFSG